MGFPSPAKGDIEDRINLNTPFIRYWLNIVQCTRVFFVETLNFA